MLRHGGTRFEVRVDPSSASLEVRVRHGTVEWNHSESHHQLTAGQALLKRRGDSPELRAIDLAGESWNWIQAAASPFDIDGLTIREIVFHLAAEHGWEVRFQGETASASQVVFRGSAAGLTGQQTLELVLASAGLEYRMQDGILWIH